MPRFGPVKRSDLIRYLKELGFQGPYEGGRHQFMIRGQLKLRIPNPHGSDIGRDLLSKILRQAEIGREEWEQL